MQAYRKEAERLRHVNALVRDRFSRFGVNKKREVTRLLYEISKRENIPPPTILLEENFRKFNQLKTFLLQRRFPSASRESGVLRPYLPQIELSSASCFRLRKDPFYPRRIFIEESVRDSYLAGRFKKAFPRAVCSEITTIKDYLKRNKKIGVFGYNKRCDTVFIVRENYDFFKSCPCTKRSVPCGYHILNLSFGCIYECTYCYLQEYVNSPGIIFPANLEDYFDRFTTYRNSASARAWQRGPYLQLGTGEFSDSLMLDGVTGYSLPLVEFFSRQKGVIFEFKTKSSNIDNLLKVKPAGNIAVAWSLNPQGTINENEFYTAPLSERIDSAGRCLQAGYKLAFHFDPVLYYEGWEKEYASVVEGLFSRIKPRDVAWISLGTLRFKPQLKKIIEARFPGSKILEAEMVLGYDDKLRYSDGIRHKIYKFLILELQKHSPKLPLYLCMEEKKMWNELKIPFPFK